jgi:hypothetical protein
LLPEPEQTMRTVSRGCVGEDALDDRAGIEQRAAIHAAAPAHCVMATVPLVVE